MSFKYHRSNIEYTKYFTIEKLLFRYYALKILSMADVIKLKQVEHVKNEKNILSQVDSVWNAC